MEMTVCRVCSKNYTGSLQLGARVCRACAAFFRRAVEGKKHFVCRRGTGNCPLNCPRKVLCQKCRLEKCMEMGVKYDQGDSIMCVDDVELPAIGQAENPEQSLPPGSSNCSLQSILIKYRKNRERRAELEPILLSSSAVKNPIEIEGKTISVPTFRLFCSIMRKDQSLLVEMVEESFRKLQGMPTQHKVHLYNNFFAGVWLLELLQNTYNMLHLPNDSHSPKRLMLLSGFYLDGEGHSHFYAEATGREDLNALMHVTTLLFSDLYETVVSTFSRVAPDEIEFIALFCLILWAPKVQRSFGDRLGSKYRAQVFNDLHDYYRDHLKMESYTKRLGDVMMLFSEIQLAVKRVASDVVFVKLFKIHEVDPFMYEVFSSTTSI